MVLHVGQYPGCGTMVHYCIQNPLPFTTGILLCRCSRCRDPPSRRRNPPKMIDRWEDDFTFSNPHLTTTPVLYRSCDQNCNFRKFKMADGRHYENSFIPVVNYPISIKFGSQMQISIPRMAIWQKSKFFKFKMADGRHIENCFFGYILGLYWPINEIRNGDDESRADMGRDQKWKFSQIHDGGWPLFWKQFSFFSPFL